MRSAPDIDLEALLVALVLAPSTLSRNRFFSLYTCPETRRVRRRAALLRSLARQLISGAGRAALAPAEGGGALLTYDVPSLGLKRTAVLEPLELAVLRIAVARGASRPSAQQHTGPARSAEGATLPSELRPEPADTLRIERALARLLPVELLAVERHAGALDLSGPGEPGEPDAAARPLPCDRTQRDTQAP